MNTKPPEQELTFAQMMKTVLAVALIGIGVVFYFQGKKKEEMKQSQRDIEIVQRREEDKRLGIGNESTAKRCAQDEVKTLLNVPNSAKFPWYGGDATAHGSEKYTVRGKVTAKNLYGVELESQYYCDIKVIDPDSYPISCISDCRLN